MPVALVCFSNRTVYVYSLLQSLSEEELKQYSKIKKENEKKEDDEESLEEATSSEEVI